MIKQVTSRSGDLQDCEDDLAKDTEQAKKHAAFIREQGLQKYKQKLLKELEADKRRKLLVVNIFFLLAMVVLAMLYYWQTNKDFKDLDYYI